MSGEAVPASPDTLEPIKRVKAAEEGAQSRLAAWNVKAKSELESLTQEGEAAVAEARIEADRARERLLQRARSEAEREAERILAEGREKASNIQGLTAGDLESRREEILDLVLGEFRARERRPES